MDVNIHQKNYIVYSKLKQNEWKKIQRKKEAHLMLSAVVATMNTIQNASKIIIIAFTLSHWQ